MVYGGGGYQFMYLHGYIYEYMVPFRVDVCSQEKCLFTYLFTEQGLLILESHVCSPGLPVRNISVLRRRKIRIFTQPEFFFIQ